VDDSPKAEIYHSDGNPSYKEVSYWGGKHHANYDKSETYTVEGINSDLRKYIPFLQWRSKCFLRSLATAKIVLHIFVYAYNKFNQMKLTYPKLKTAFHLIQFV
jgi:IS1 family transposase